MHNGNGHGHGNGGKRWLLIGLLVLGGFWIVNDAYDDGFRDAMLASGQGATIRRYHGGPDFPWGLIILGGIGYVAWRKGAFDHFGGPGGPFDGGGRGIQRYGNGGGYLTGQGPAQTPGAPTQGQGYGPSFRGPRAFFEDWHRQAHQAQQAQYPAPPVPPAPPAGQHSARAQASNGGPGGEVYQTPPPPPPAPDYWASMSHASGATESAATPGAPYSPPPAPAAAASENADGPRDAAGPAPERW